METTLAVALTFVAMFALVLIVGLPWILRGKR
jgi:hypothetical protein